MSESTAPKMSARELAEAERKAASVLHFGNVFIPLVAVVVAFLIGLFLSHTGDVKGLDVLLYNQTAQDANIRLPERVFVTLGTLSLVVFSSLALVTKRTVFANIAYLLAGMALFTSIFGLWIRIQTVENEGGTGIGAGMYLEVAAVVVAVFAYSLVILRRSPEQLEIARRRAEQGDLDEIGYAQRSAMVAKQQGVADENPLLVDDRRQRASERHNREK